MCTQEVGKEGGNPTNRGLGMNKTSDGSKAQFPPPFLKFGFVFIEIYSQASTCFPAGMRGQAATEKNHYFTLLLVCFMTVTIGL